MFGSDIYLGTVYIVINIHMKSFLHIRSQVVPLYSSTRFDSYIVVLRLKL